MADYSHTPNLEDSNISDPEDFFASPRLSTEPSYTAKTQSKAPTNTARSVTQTLTPSQSGDRDAVLRAELESVRRINTVIEGVIASLEQAKSNMETVSRTVTHASTLLDTWTRILSQTEHNQRLILNPAWNGASQDAADEQQETLSKHRERERREAEESQRREALEQSRVAEEERRRVEAAVAGPSAGRGRGAARGRTGSAFRGSRVAESTTSGGRGTRRGISSGYGRVGAVGTGSRAMAGTNSRSRGRGLG